MGFMKVNEGDLIADLKHSVVEVVYEKPDGKVRSMKGTLQAFYVKKELSAPEMEAMAGALNVNEDPPQRVLFLWDVDNSAWWAIRLDKVYSCQLMNS